MTHTYNSQLKSSSRLAIKDSAIFLHGLTTSLESILEAEKIQPSDFIVNSIKGAALVKTCEKFLPLEKQPVFTSNFDVELKSHIEAGGSAKDFLEYDEVKRKRKQKRIKPVITAASDFSVLRDMLDIQKGKKSKRIEDLKLIDFNGTDFKEVSMLDKETGEILIYKVKGKGKYRKFILQSAMSKRDDRLSMQKVMAKLLPEYRVSKCLCCVQSNAKALNVYKSKAHGSISVSNLQTCGSVWHDPWCAAKITERRRVEMNKANKLHKADGGTTSFATRTVPHTKKNSLLFLRDGFSKADKYMKKNKKYTKMLLRFAASYNIKNFETTVSHINGWHLHVHELFFHDAGAFEGAALESNPAYVAFLKDFEQIYYEIWRDAAMKAGFDMPSREHGLQVQNGDFAAEYIAKWGCEPESKWDTSTELTKAHIKKSRNGFTPWDLIRLYRDTGDERLVPIIKEYAHTMHGEQQLIWSKGAKKHFKVGELTDEEIADQVEDEGEEIGVLSPVQWKFIVKNDFRSEFFSFASQGWDELTNFLHSFEDYPRIFSLEALPKKS